MPTHNGHKCSLWAPNFGVSGSWSWRVSWWPYSCRKRMLGSRRGTPFADSPVLASVGSIYWRVGPRRWCLRSAVRISHSPPPLSEKGCRAQECLCVCVSSCFLLPLRSTGCWLIVVKVHSESFYAHIMPPCPVVSMWKSPYIGPGLVTLCDKTKEEKTADGSFRRWGWQFQQRGKMKRWHFHAAVKGDGGILFPLNNKGSC